MKLIFLCALIIPLILCANPENKPNILMIVVDDLNDWIRPLGGHTQVKTPNLDRLQKRSIQFTNAHCSAPVCGASRTSFLTGILPSSSGIYTNQGTESSDTATQPITLPQHLKDNGYHTMGIGKIAHTGVSDGNGILEWNEIGPSYEIQKEIHVQRGNGYGSKEKGDYKYYPFPKEGSQINAAFGKVTKGQSLCWGALERDEIPSNGVMPDEMFAQWGAKKLQSDLPGPFFLSVGFIRPHVPFTAPKEFFDLYPLESISLPDVITNEMDDIPEIGKAMALGIIPGGDHQAVLKLGENYWKELIRSYLACVSFVDAQIGVLLDSLENSPYKNNTAIILFSDHGQNLGEKTSWRKMNLWEESTKVPLFISTPNQSETGISCIEPASLLDLYPTIIDLCQLPPKPELEGQSLLPFIQNPSLKRKAPVITTWGYKNHAVRDQKYRYISYRDGTQELYDHSKDPNEHHNQSNNPEYKEIIQHLKSFLPTTNSLPSGKSSWEDDFIQKRLKLLKSDI